MNRAERNIKDKKKQEILNIRNFYENGMSEQEIAHRTRRTKVYIKEKIKSLGLKRKIES